MNKLVEIGLRLLDPVIAVAVIGLIIQTLFTTGVIGDIEVNTVTKVASYIIDILILIGVMKQPNSTK